MKTPQDHYIKIGTVNTRYWAEGNQGSVVVLIHGIGQYVESWLPSFDALATTHRVYALDLLGHGRTDKPLEASCKIIDLARFVKEFMSALGIERAHIVGHSLGGALALQLTLLHPSVVDKLVLLDSAGLGREVAMALRIMNIPLLGELLTRPNRAGSDDLVKLLVHDPAVMTDELIELSYQMSLLPNAQKSFLKTLRTIGNFLGQGKSMYQPIMGDYRPSRIQFCWFGDDKTKSSLSHTPMSRGKSSRISACIYSITAGISPCLSIRRHSMNCYLIF